MYCTQVAITSVTANTFKELLLTARVAIQEDYLTRGSRCRKYYR